MYLHKEQYSEEIDPLVAKQMGDDSKRAIDKEDEAKFQEMFLSPKNCEKMWVPRVDENVWRKQPEEKQRKKTRVCRFFFFFFFFQYLVRMEDCNG